MIELKNQKKRTFYPTVTLQRNTILQYLKPLMKSFLTKYMLVAMVDKLIILAY